MATDKKLSAAGSVSDASYIYAETSDGKFVKISKADLASVVAGLLGFGTFLRVDKTITASAQSTTQNTGAFFVSGSSTTDAVYDTGIMINFSKDSNVIQLKLCLNTKNILFRSGVLGSPGTWSTVF